MVLTPLVTFSGTILYYGRLYANYYGPNFLFRGFKPSFVTITRSSPSKGEGKVLSPLAGER